MSMLETKGLCKNYGSNTVLSDVDLQIHRGEFVAANPPYCIVSAEWISCLPEKYVLTELIWLSCPESKCKNSD